MEIFTLSRTNWREGKIVNGIKSAVWVERYRDPGEFTIVAIPSVELLTQLSIGTFLSHTDTKDFMIVETHELTEDAEDGPELIISGRSATTIYEQRILTPGETGFYIANPDTGPYPRPDDWIQRDFPYQIKLSATSRRTRAQEILEYNSLSTTPWIDAQTGTVGFNITTQASVPAFAGEMVIRRGNKLDAAIDMLTVTDSGMRAERPVPLVGSSGTTNAQLYIHNGIDKSTLIQFSVESGELSDARYLWSNKSYKNAAVVVGQYHAVSIIPGTTGFDTRIMVVDANDINDRYIDYKDPLSKLTGIQQALTRRGLEALAAQSLTYIVEANATKSTRYVYRKDYNIGDQIKVVGRYGLSANMRVTEYTEVDDENGESSYPTLSAV